jgi:diphthine synthase
MTLHLIGLGLEKDTISLKANKILQKCEKVYLENYTVNFPYSTQELEESLGINIEERNREEVEDETIVKEAKEKEVALLVYGDALSATTHTQLLLSCKKENIPCQVYHNASIMTAIAKTGLQLYKFGKTASMPKWKKSYNPTSFLDYYTNNQKIKAHTLILTDIGLNLDEALDQLEKSCKEKEITFDKIIVISYAGNTKEKLYYDSIEKLKETNIQMPFCIILPSKMHFHEEEYLEMFKEDI